MIEKYFFATSNRKKYVKSMFQVDNMQNGSLQIKFGKKSVADFSKECAFPLPQRKFHCAVISFSGSAEVAAGLSNFGRDRRGPRESDGSRTSIHGIWVILDALGVPGIPRETLGMF